MSFLTVLTDDTVSETWSGGNNKSDSWSSLEADGGSITRKLGDPSTQAQATVAHTNANQVVKVHLGTWVTDVGSGEAFTIPATATFGITDWHGYETAGQLNAYLAYKISVVTESGGVLSYDRILVDWQTVQVQGTDLELATAAGDSLAMGGYGNSGVINFVDCTNTTIAVGERLAIEVGADIRGGRNGDSAVLEYGSVPNVYNDASLADGAAGTGLYSCSVVVPINFTETYQDQWGTHSEFEVPWVVGTNIIPWADIGADWSSAKWVDTGAARYVSRADGVVTSQFWVFQDDDYLYVAGNNIIDGCIQNSDHQELFLCPTNDWVNEVETDPQDWVFRRSITSGTSETRNPILPIIDQKSTDVGEYILQGDNAAVFPEGWELPIFDSTSRTFAFSSNAYTWQDGVDFRMAGPGATSTAPAPNATPGGAYTEWKISKAKLNNWDGVEQIGMMLNLQCDVQGNGHTMFPTQLGNQVDKADWFFCGAIYEIGESKTSANQNTVERMDLRPIMSGHAHGLAPAAVYNPTVNITTGSTTQNAAADIAYDIAETITADSLTQSAALDIDYYISVSITAESATQSAGIGIGGIAYQPTVNITADSTTQDSVLLLDIRPSLIVTADSTTQDAIIGKIFEITDLISADSTTQDADINVGTPFSITLNITASSITKLADMITLIDSDDCVAEAPAPIIRPAIGGGGGYIDKPVQVRVMVLDINKSELIDKIEVTVELLEADDD